MYFWVELNKKVLYDPKNWVGIFLVAFAMSAVSSLHNQLQKTMNIPWILKVVFLGIYIAITWKIYYDWKKQKKKKV